MSTFVPNLPATQVHARLQSALEAYQKAEQSAVLWFADLAARKLYRELEYSSMKQYVMEALGFSEARYYQFQRLSERLAALPELRQSVANGSVPWTNAREVAAVATPDTERAWVDVAKVTSRRELRRRIESVRERQKAVRRRPVTSDQVTLDVGPGVTASPAAVLEVMAGISLHFTPEQLAAFESLLEAAMKSGERGKREEILLALMARGASNSQPMTSQEDTRVPWDPKIAMGDSPYRIIVQACPECGRASVNTSRGALPLSLVELEQLSCDAVIERDGKNRATIPPRLRRQVLARDRYRCQVAGCGRSLFLNVHHLVHRETGGPNALNNLTVLCSACHRMLHKIGERRRALENEAQGLTAFSTQFHMVLG